MESILNESGSTVNSETRILGVITKDKTKYVNVYDLYHTSDAFKPTDALTF